MWTLLISITRVMSSQSSCDIWPTWEITIEFRFYNHLGQNLGQNFEEF